MKRRKQRIRRLLFSVFVLLGTAAYWYVQPLGEEPGKNARMADTLVFDENKSSIRNAEADDVKSATEDARADNTASDIKGTKGDAGSVKSGGQPPETSPAEAITVKGLTAKRVSPTQIGLFWNRADEGDFPVYSQYIIMRKKMSGSADLYEWEKVESLPAEDSAGKNAEGYGYSFTDTLLSQDPVQYEYRIDGQADDGSLFLGSEESRVLASNILVCIDPGHYKGRALAINDGSYTYEEGIFTLKVGLALREELAAYGISSYLTRETDSITIGGYTNEALDQRHLRLRGEYAAGSNLFLSIHTNANNDNANGYDTCGQPLEINKTVLIANQLAGSSAPAVKIANEIGSSLTAASYRLGLSVTDQFEQVEANGLNPWTDEYNDSLNVRGTVCYRLGNDGDYYAVLKGSAAAGVPGLIIEHGYHTVQKVRRAAMTGELAAEWAKADAEGIARGLGFLAIEN